VPVPVVFTVRVTIPVELDIPLALTPGPLRVTVELFTGALVSDRVTLKVTSVSVPTVTVVGFAKIFNVGVGNTDIIAVPLLNPIRLAVAVIVPAEDAFTLNATVPANEVVPVLLALPVSVIVAPFTDALVSVRVTLKVTLVGVPAVTLVGFATTFNVGIVGGGDVVGGVIGGVIGGVVGGAFVVTVAVPSLNPEIFAVAIIAPAEVALTLITAVPADEVVPVPVAAPVRVTVALLTDAFVSIRVTLKVTLVGVPTVIAVGFATTFNEGIIGAVFAIIVAVPLLKPSAFAVTLIAPAEVALTLITTIPVDEVVPVPVAAPVRVTVA